MSAAAGRRARWGPPAAAALAGFVAALLWSARFPPAPIDGTDAEQYIGLARRFLAGQGLALWTQAEYQPSLYREPGYPLLLAAVGTDQPPRLLLLQAALVGLVGACMAVLARWSGLTARWATLAGVLAVTSASLLDLARQPLSEALSIFLFTLSFTAFVAATRSDRPLLFGASGVLFGLTTLVRAPMAGVAAVLFAAWALLAIKERRRFRAIASRAGLAAVLLALVLAPWLARNWWQLDAVTLTSRSGIGLLRRASRALYPWEYQRRWAHAAVWMVFNPLSQFVAPQSSFQYGPAYWQNELWDLHTNEARWAGTRYDRTCRLYDLDRCERDVAIDIAVHRPLTYLANTGLEWVKLNFYPLPGGVAADRNLRVWLALASVAVLARARALHGVAGWTALALAAYTALHLPFDLQERYGAPLLPGYALLTTLALARMATGLRASAREKRRRRVPLLSASHQQK